MFCNEGKEQCTHCNKQDLIWTHMGTDKAEDFSFLFSSKVLGQGNEKTTALLPWTFTQKASVGGF